MSASRLLIADTTALRDPAVIARLLPLVPDARREKVSRLIRIEDQALSLGAGLLLRCAGIERISIDENGKPRSPGICFNLSHSGRYALLALSDTETGCDCERKGQITLQLAERFFHPGEAGRVRRDASEADRLWVLKESYIKCTGLGLARQPLDSFEIDTDADPVRLGDCLFFEYDEPEGYRCAVCVRSPVARPEERPCMEYIDLMEVFA